MNRLSDIPGTVRWLSFAFALWYVANSFFWVGGVFLFERTQNEGRPGTAISSAEFR